MVHQLIHRQLLTELYSNNEGTKLIARNELSKNILISIAYRKLEAEGYLTFSYSSSKNYLIKITNLGVDVLKIKSK